MCLPVLLFLLWENTHRTSEQLSCSWRNRQSPQPSLKSPHRAQAQAGPTCLRPKAPAPTDSTLPHKHRAPAVCQEVFGLKGFQTKQKSTKEKVEPTRNARPHTTVNPSITIPSQTPSSHKHHVNVVGRTTPAICSLIHFTPGTVIRCWPTRNNPDS